MHSETASFQTAMPVPVRYSADTTQGKENNRHDIHATVGAATKLSDRKKQKESTDDDDLPAAVEELERQLLVAAPTEA